MDLTSWRVKYVQDGSTRLIFSDKKSFQREKIYFYILNPLLFYCHLRQGQSHIIHNPDMNLCWRTKSGNIHRLRSTSNSHSVSRQRCKSTRQIVLKFLYISESSRWLVKTQIVGSYLKRFNSIGQGGAKNLHFQQPHK